MNGIIYLGHYQYGPHHSLIWGGDLYEVKLKTRSVFVRRVTCYPDSPEDENFDSSLLSLQDNFSVIEGEELEKCLDGIGSWADDDHRVHHYNCVVYAIRLHLMADKK